LFPGSTKLSDRPAQKLRRKALSGLTLTAVYRYPVKSLAGQAHDELAVGARGLLFDRHWMLVDEQLRFLTQRQQSRMALITARVDDRGGLTLQAPGASDLVVGAGADNPEHAAVRVWDDMVQASFAGAAADRWLSAFLGTPCHLVSMPGEVRRAVDPGFALPQDQVGFADGFPFLLISQASLDDLNRRLEVPLAMQRFRPNLVVDGCAPYAEDSWRRIRIGELTFRVVKPCSRCIIPTIDPETAERGAEPLRTLMSYRRRDNKIYFGQNLIHDGPGRLAPGMSVEVLA
jgi:hypothetical protein